MDFDLEKLQDIVSPYFILLKKSKIEFVTNALAERMGVREDELKDLFEKVPSILEGLDNNSTIMPLPAKDNKTLNCSFTSTMFEDTRLLAFSDYEKSDWTHFSDDASEIFPDLVSQLPVGCVIVEKGHIVCANNAFAGIINCPREGVLGRQLVSFVTRDSRQDYIKACEEGIQDPDRRIVPREIILNTSYFRRINVVIHGAWHKKGDRDYLLLVFDDVTEKKLLERRYREEQLKYTDLFEGSPIGILNISPRGVVLDCNTIVCNLMGYDKEEIKNALFHKFVPEHQIQTLENDFKVLFTEGQRINKHECLLRRKDGENLTVEYSAQAVSKRGHLTMAMMVLADITEKKTLEIELLDKNAEMEKTLWEMAEVKDALEARAGELNKATEDLKLLNEKLNLLSITDGLTEIYNHRHFQDRLSEEVERVHRQKDGLLSLLILDIDDFKKFNDTYGHQCGDMVLKQLAGILKGNVRTIDIIARYGGEEFAVILPNSSTEDATIVAERICEAVRSTPFTFGDGTSVKVTVSIGVGMLLNGQGEKSELIRKADNALYAAKAKWKDRVEVWEED